MWDSIMQKPNNYTNHGKKKYTFKFLAIINGMCIFLIIFYVYIYTFTIKNTFHYYNEKKQVYV